MTNETIAGHIINDNFFEYIERNSTAGNVTKLLLKKEDVDFDKKFAITQIECRNKFKAKIPSVLANARFLFPKAICGEQCTHETVANLHASLFSADDTVLDMTMGLGIDSFYISRVASHVTAIEYDAEIADTARHNYAGMATNIKVINANSAQYIESCKEHYSTIFIDPARRDSNNKRMFGFHDCVPDVLELMPHIARCTSRLIIKASPMLDITKSLEELPNVTDIWIVAVKNSCKELLFILSPNSDVHNVDVTIHTINYDNVIQKFDYRLNDAIPNGTIATADTIAPGCTLLEPNACILKGGETQRLAINFPSIKKLDISSHLFISEYPVNDFPGRQFAIDEIIPFKDKNLRKLKAYKTLNVSTRNFRLTPDQLKTRLGVKDGGDQYLFGTTLADGNMVLILCHKHNSTADNA